MRTSFITTLLSASLLSVTALADSSIPIYSGGTGQSSRDEIAQVQNNYNTKLIFTGDKGMYLSDVNISIKNQAGEQVLNTMTDGPIFLAQLPAGKYSVEASTKGYVEKQNVQVGANGLKTYQVRFPIADEEDFTTGDRSASAQPATGMPMQTGDASEDYNVVYQYAPAQ